MALTYQRVAAKYGTSAPQGFVQYCHAHGIASDQAINTCGVRLSYAIFQAYPDFFKDVEAKSKTEWYGLPTRASDLAIVLNRKVKKGELVRRPSVAGKKGIVFFDTIQGFGGTGHISLWNGQGVVDLGDYFSNSPRVYFWELPN